MIAILILMLLLIRGEMTENWLDSSETLVRINQVVFFLVGGKFEVQAEIQFFVLFYRLGHCDFIPFFHFTNE